MRIAHNLSALNTHRFYNVNNNKLSKSLEKLSTGYAVNRAGDNAAGLAVSEKMRSQINGLKQASNNAQEGILLVQTFEGALTETDSILQRMKSLAVQSANGAYDNHTDRAAIQLEYDQLIDEINRIADTDYNGIIMLNGGKMADGLEAVPNDDDTAMIFDYEFYASQPMFKGTGSIANASKVVIEIDENASDTVLGMFTYHAPGDVISTDKDGYETIAGSYDWYKKDGTAIDSLVTITATRADPDDPLSEIDVDFTPGDVVVINRNSINPEIYNRATAVLTYSNELSLQTGSRTKDLVSFKFNYSPNAINGLTPDLNCSAEGLGVTGTSVVTQQHANLSIDKIDNALNKVSMVRATFGALQNRLEHKIANINVNTENITAAESRIRDTDMASEMMKFTKNKILTEASMSMLAQANQLPQNVLSLFV